MYLARRGVRSVLMLKLVHRTLRGRAYGMVFGTCSTSSCVRNVRCFADACYLPEWSVRLKFIIKLVSRILRGCAYRTAFVMCSPSGATFDVCAFMCASTEVGRCNPSRVPIVASMRVCTCTAFGMYEPNGVLSVQKCVCVCLHRAWGVSSERCT